jgi:hypothetical protein
MAAVLFVACASIVEAGPLPTLVHSPRAASVLKLRGGKATTPPAAPVLPDAVKALGGAATLGSVLGYCSGAAARTAAQGVTVAVGCATGSVLLLSTQLTDKHQTIVGALLHDLEGPAFDLTLRRQVRLRHHQLHKARARRPERARPQQGWQSRRVRLRDTLSASNPRCASRC